ncbi:rhamnogalacturonan lyase, partial [Kineococcus glutinatus]|uniref:rhamnogalacturonan lyase n=1 Tax=Kineococcus glutinatus TaxID=1070872 RepID=UPI0031F03066
MERRRSPRPTALAATALVCLGGLALAPAASADDSSRTSPHAATPERLDRGVVAVPTTGGYLVSWRALATDAPGTGFAVYRDGRRVASVGATAATTVVDPGGRAGARYEVRAVVAGREQRGRDAGTTRAWASNALDIPLDKPADGVDPEGVPYTYTANDVAVGDLDGDGDLDYVLKWYPSNAKDNAFAGYTGNVLIDAYTLEGEKLWRIDLGRNIRAGAHYTQMAVQDFDGDGRAEVSLKTADGTRDSRGKVIGDPDANWVATGGAVPSTDRTGGIPQPDGTYLAELKGRILSGPEYLSVFDGRSGRVIDTTRYVPARHPDTDNPTYEQLKEVWGDGYANRSDRFLGGVASFDGQRQSIVMARGYYGRSVVAAWDLRRGKLVQRWVFDTSDPALGAAWEGQGNHQFSVADVDADGKDEIVYGSIAIDDDGTGLWNAGLGHGDAMHVGDLDPNRPGLEKFGVHECMVCSGGVGAAMLDAATGARIWTAPSDRDTGRGVAFDVDPASPGVETWASRPVAVIAADGRQLAATRPGSMNFGIWWDGDLGRELLDGGDNAPLAVSEYDPATVTAVPVFSPAGILSNNGTKANPAISGDLFGDWREEFVARTDDSTALRVFTTDVPTTHRITTLLQDPAYRAQLAAQNNAYNQPPATSFFLGYGMAGQQ